MTDEPVSTAPAASSSAPLPDADARPYMQVWAESLASVLGQITGSARGDGGGRDFAR
jgi:hypothetical protein